MKIGSDFFQVRIVALGVVVAIAGGSAVVWAEANSQTRGQELANLQDAYHMLKIADKDYHGHRAKAMKAVEAACGEINGAAEGRHRGREAQSTSDEQMRSAARVLESVRNLAGNMDQPNLSKHVSKALEEIRAALSLK